MGQNQARSATREPELGAWHAAFKAIPIESRRCFVGFDLPIVVPHIDSVMVLGSFLLSMSLVLGCLSVFCVDHNLTEDTFDITDTVFRHGNNWEDGKKPAKGISGTLTLGNWAWRKMYVTFNRKAECSAYLTEFSEREGS